MSRRKGSRMRIKAAKRRANSAASKGKPKDKRTGRPIARAA